MKITRTLATCTTPDGARLTLHEHDGHHFLKVAGLQLMSTTASSSEERMAELSCAHLPPQPRVLIGGLGFGFTLKRVLELVGADARVDVAELLPEVVAWNREFLAEVNGKLLDDPRVQVLVADVFEVIRLARPASYDAILLDVDNGPTSLVQAKNSRLYDRRGFGLIRRALKAEGRVAFWSACAEPAFPQELGRSGFHAEVFPVKPHERAKRAAHCIYVAQRRDAPPPPPPVEPRVPFVRRHRR